MKTIIGMFWGVMAGLFLAFGVIVATELLTAGGDLLGFTEWTYRYYMVCLFVCAAILICSKPARANWQLMGLFFVAVVMVLAVGFQSSMDVSGGQDQIAKMQASMQAMGVFIAKAVMYVAPGALVGFYGFIAFESVR